MSFILFFYSSLICPFSLFWPGETYLVLTIIFSCDLAYPLAFLVSWALLPFGFLTAFSSFLIIEISLASMILVGIFHERKFIQAQQRTTRDIFILECERDNKDDLFSFQAQTVKINKLRSRLM